MKEGDLMSNAQLLNEFETYFNIERIKNLSVVEKFKLVDVIGLIYQEAQFAGQVGLLNLNKSRNYTVNKTYNLYAMLVSNGTKYEILKKIIKNYARNFEKSDVYYAHTITMGIGLMMIDKGFHPKVIYKYLMHLLGKEFLIENLHFDGRCKVKKEDVFDVAFEIEYKPFDENIKKIKYDLLAILKYSHENGSKATTELVNTKYKNKEFRYYYNIMNITDPETQNHLYEFYDAQVSRRQRLMLAGAYAIYNKLDLYTAHYLFNSIIGKYSRFDKDSGEIEMEIEKSCKELRE